MTLAQGQGMLYQPDSREFTVVTADCIAAMAGMAESSVDAIVTDPPYGLEFMGKEWDHGVPGSVFWVPALRVLKPGGHLLAFGGTRTYHRLVCAIEDAGFEVRDTIAWMYGSGFPKSLDVSKAIDKAARGFPQGTHRVDPENPNAGGFKTQRTEGKRSQTDKGQHFGAGPGSFMAEAGEPDRRAITDPAAQRWAGWGTALKPAFEPIVVARKPLVGTVAANVLAHGTGALNIDACRVEPTGETMDRDGEASRDRRYADRGATNFAATPGVRGGAANGRFPANVIHDGSDEVLEVFTLAGPTSTTGKRSDRSREAVVKGTAWGVDNHKSREYANEPPGSAARFFYCAKASKQDRGVGNTHPTVKPVALMRYLVRLVTPPGGVVLDPFTGSGSTGVACAAEGFRFLGVEREAAYVEIANRRCAEAWAGLRKMAQP